MQRARFALASVLTVLVFGVAYWRVRPLEPHLDISVRRELHQEDRAIYEVRIQLRGGESLDRIAMEVLRGPVAIAGSGRVLSPSPGTWFKAYVTVTGATAVPASVRIVQTGRVNRVYDVDLEEWRLR